MTHILKVLIVDPDRFFVAGLQYALKKHLHAKGIPVLFMNQQSCYPTADLIFWAPGCPTTVIPIGVLSTHKSKLIMITTQRATNKVKYYAPWVFYRHQNLDTLLSLIDQVKNAATMSNNDDVIKQYDVSPLRTLSPRQQEVMYYISTGMSSREIAGNMQINVKTVSSHKRTAMVKLQLKRTVELHHWLLYNPL